MRLTESSKTGNSPTLVPLFVLLGDSFLCEEKRKEILISLQKEFGPDLPITLRRAGDLPVSTLLAEARTLPFLSRAQVFCIREADEFTKKDLELWESYFDSPPPTTFFIFEATSLPKGHPFLEWARQGKRLFSLEPESEKIAANFIRRKLSQAQKKMTPEALDLLAFRVGDSFVFLDSLLDQLILYSGEKPEIDRSAVEAFEEKLLRFEGYDLVQSLAERNLSKALEILADLLEQGGQDTPSLVGLLHWQLRRFWEAKKWRGEGISEREVSTRLRLFPAKAALFFKQLEYFSLRELEKILDELFHLDWRLKTGRAAGRTEVETWLVNAIG